MAFTKKVLAATAATALVSGPVIAQAAQPASDAARSTATTNGESNLEGDGSGIILAILAAAAIIAGIIIAADSGDDTPTSP